MDGNTKQARKGTRSCTECRRRKVRCLRFSEDSEVCRRCEERGSKCIPQGYTARIRRDDKLPSRQRISQLELQVANLSKAVHGIESRLGNRLAESTSPATDQTPDSELYSDDSDDGSISDTLASEPSHLRSLFQNDWLSADVHPHDEHSQERKAKATGQILVVAKQALKKLMPSRSSVTDIPESAFKWLIFLDTLFPDKLAARSRSEILDSYDDMKKEDVDAVSLALWLLAVAITAHQVPDEHRTPSTEGKDYKRWVEFSQELSETIERFILSHDRLVGTVHGLGIALHYFRLQISQGNFQKGWIRLRHYVVIAELMGLPKASRTAVLKGGFPDERQTYKADLWNSICAVDRLFGMVMNLSPGTTRYDRELQPLILEGIVQPWEYLCRLSDIAVRIQLLDEAGTVKGFNAELCDTALELTQDLKTLASYTPESWWVTHPVDVKPDHIVQLLHYSMLMRAYLPFTVHQKLSKEYASSRLAGMEVCESVVQRYLYLRQALPPGFLLAQILDLQAFTASVVLLLTIHNSIGMDQTRLNNDRARIENEVAQVVEAMNEKSREMTGSGFARSGAATISSLSRLLGQEADADGTQELVLKAPLLGKVHVRRNPSAGTAPQAIKSGSTHGIPAQNNWRPNDQQPGLPTVEQPATYPESQIDISRFEQDAWPLDPFSWSIEDNQENFFEDTLMAENFDQLATWQYGDNGFIL